MRRSKITAVTLYSNPRPVLVFTRNYISPHVYRLDTWKRRDRAERLLNRIPHEVHIMDISRPYYILVQWERTP